MSPKLIEKNYLSPHYSTISEEKSYRPKESKEGVTFEAQERFKKRISRDETIHQKNY